MEAAAAASRKRKICHDHDDEVEDDEQKMEKFYDLIRNIREARDRLMNGSVPTKGLQNKKNKKKAEEDHHQEQTNIQVWTPSFEREDFMEESRREAQFKTVHAGTTSEREAGARKEKDKEEEEEERLDLKLSL
ncbi:hypothetical protein I3843_07G120100 [Carya illinoinensis]|uniref:Protein NIM1-INTERACTING 1 n=1 Tax=Carya illinoinensis TaxID=32201 RepID=A0A8T1Q1J0_CARIL|nr:hypothetical protein I3760_07G120700 [Carya illinoinensis]KAG6648064.1 hypothetical protein CIPAW_07G122100 [Carya illinoinensis]KAG6704220.1 hypothetical protein I3842_07G125100 [Carya illinoinensis]KAG7971131.1 hypothetical protein I3843_07G120100 [Carya illinoinensis]